MDKTRPIRIFWQDGVTKRQIIFVLRTIKRVLKLAGMEEKIVVQIGGFFDTLIYRDEDTKSKFFWQYDGQQILNYFSAIHQASSHNEYYAVLLMKDEFFLDTLEGKKIVLGLAQREESAIIYVDYDSFFEHDSVIKCRTLSTTIHELGHIFNLPDPERKEEIVLSSVSKTNHCANDCVMYPCQKGFKSDYKFCPTCLRELRDYFKIILTNFGTISP